MNNQICKTTETQKASSLKYVRPRYRVSSDQNGYTATVEVPGCSKDGVQLSFENKSLEILAHREKVTGEDRKILFAEAPQSDYKLTLQVNVDVDQSAITAKVENGLLTVQLPIAESAKAQSIAVE